MTGNILAFAKVVAKVAGMNFVFERFLEYYKANPVKTTVNIMLSATFPVDDFLVPYLTGQIVTSVHKRKPFLRPLVYLTTLLITMQVFFSVSAWHDAIVLPNMQNHIRHEMLSDLLKEFHQSEKEPNVGEVMSRLIKIPLTTTCLFEQAKNHLLPYLLSFVITSAYIMKHDWKLGLVILICILAVYAIILLSPSRCMNATVEQDVALSRIDEQTEDLIRNLTTVYVSDQTNGELRRLRGFEKEYEDNYAMTMTCIMRTRLLAICVMAFIIAYTAHVCYVKTMSGAMTAGTFIAIFLIVIQWFGTLGWVVGNCRELVIDWGIISAYESMKQNNVVKKDVGLYWAKPTCKLLDVNGIFFDSICYSVKTRSAPILKSISLHVQQGERIAIIGDIGAGKSTMLKLLLRLQTPTSGEIYINGEPISCMPLTSLRKTVGFVAQNPILFSRSIYENITYGVPNVDRNQVTQLIDSLGLTEAFANIKGGIDAPAGKTGSALSGGQKQLVACMRAILLNPEFIALDEITSSIDAHTKQKLLTVLDRLFYGKTVVIVTHDMDLLPLVDTVYNMQDGQLLPVARN